MVSPTKSVNYRLALLVGSPIWNTGKYEVNQERMQTFREIEQ